MQILAATGLAFVLIGVWPSTAMAQPATSAPAGTTASTTATTVSVSTATTSRAVTGGPSAEVVAEVQQSADDAKLIGTIALVIAVVALIGAVAALLTLKRPDSTG